MVGPDGGAPTPGSASVLVSQAGVIPMPTERTFEADISPPATKIDDTKFVGFVDVTPGRVTLQLSPRIVDGGADGEAGAGDAGTVTCSNAASAFFLAWDTAADPTNESGQAYAGYTLVLGRDCF